MPQWQMLPLLLNIIFSFQCHFPELKAEAGCLCTPDINEARRKRWAWSPIFTPASGSLNCHHTSKDFPQFFQGSCESYTKLFSVSWLSSLTETKWLSFFLTPPKSLKCHRSTVSWCWLQQQFQLLILFLSFASVFIACPFSLFLFFPHLIKYKDFRSKTSLVIVTVYFLVANSKVPQQGNSAPGAMLPPQLLFLLV